MARVKLSYFDFSGGRGEDCRLALHIAGIEFEDNRVQGPQWAEMKASTPFGALPVLEVEGAGTLAQSNAILELIGRKHDLHPEDVWAGAQHVALMGAAEDLRAHLGPVLAIKDENRESARKEFAEGKMQAWASNVEAQVQGPFVAGDKLNVVDLKLFMLMRWFIGGGVDHIGPEVFSAFPKLKALYESVQTHPKVVDWYA